MTAGPPPPPPAQPEPPAQLEPLGWVLPSAGTRRSRRRTLLIVLLAIAILVAAVIAGIALVGRSFKTGLDVIAASNGSITSFNTFAGPGGTRVTFQAAVGYDVEDGPALACDVVRPVLDTSELRGARFTIVNRAGDVIASDETPCP